MKELNLIHKRCLPFHPSDSIVSPRWDDRTTRVKRSFHLCGTIKNKRHLDIFLLRIIKIPRQKSVVQLEAGHFMDVKSPMLLDMFLQGKQEADAFSLLALGRNLSFVEKDGILYDRKA